MPTFNLKWSRVTWPGLCSILLLLSGCANTQKLESTIEQRVMQRWDALLTYDLAGAYLFLSPAYRTSVSSVQYQRSVLMSKVKWTGAEFTESDCSESVCKVKILLNYTIYGALPGVSSFDGTQNIEESWVLVDRVWYYVPAK